MLWRLWLLLSTKTVEIWGTVKAVKSAHAHIVAELTVCASSHQQRRSCTNGYEKSLCQARWDYKFPSDFKNVMYIFWSLLWVCLCVCVFAFGWFSFVEGLCTTESWVVPSGRGPCLLPPLAPLLPAISGAWAAVNVIMQTGTSIFWVDSGLWVKELLSFVAGDGEPGSGCVPHHSFQGLTSRFTWSPCLRRRFNSLVCQTAFIHLTAHLTVLSIPGLFH